MFGIVVFGARAQLLVRFVNLEGAIIEELNRVWISFVHLRSSLHLPPVDYDLLGSLLLARTEFIPVFALLSGPTKCEPVIVQFSDGLIWRRFDAAGEQTYDSSWED